MPEWLLRLPAFAFLHSPPGFFGSALQGFDVPARRFGFGLQAPHVRLAGRRRRHGPLSRPVQQRVDLRPMHGRRAFRD